MMVSKEQASRSVIKEELNKLKISVLASDELAEMFAESGKAFEAARVEVASSK